MFYRAGWVRSRRFRGIGRTCGPGDAAFAPTDDNSFLAFPALCQGEVETKCKWGKRKKCKKRKKRKKRILRFPSSCKLNARARRNGVFFAPLRLCARFVVTFTPIFSTL